MAKRKTKYGLLIAHLRDQLNCMSGNKKLQQQAIEFIHCEEGLLAANDFYHSMILSLHAVEGDFINRVLDRIEEARNVGDVTFNILGYQLSTEPRIPLPARNIIVNTLEQYKEYPLQDLTGALRAQSLHPYEVLRLVCLVINGDLLIPTMYRTLVAVTKIWINLDVGHVPRHITIEWAVEGDIRFLKVLVHDEHTVIVSNIGSVITVT